MYKILENGLSNLGIRHIDEDGNYRNPIDVLLEIREVIDDLPNDQKDTIRKFFI